MLLEVHEVCLEMPKVCTMCARHGIWEQSELNTAKKCETRSNKENSSKETHLSSIQPKNVSWTFYRTPNMQQFIKTIKNAWTWWKMPQYKFKLPQGANIDAQTPNGTQPNQRIENFFTKIETKPNFWKSPIFKTLSTNSA